MLMFLLIIIAVGVLLSSEGGKELLSGLLIGLGILTAGYVLFWVVFIAYLLIAPHGHY